MRPLRMQGSPEDEPADERDEITEHLNRVGGPLLCRLPVIVQPLKVDSFRRLLWDHSLEKEVINILENYHIKIKGLAIQRRRWKYDSFTDDDETETILVLTEYQNTSRRWSFACMEIRKLCLDLNQVNLNVEISNEDGLTPMQSSIVEKEHDVWHVWSRIEPNITAIMKPVGLLALAVLRCGTSTSLHTNPVTIEIGRAHV